MAIQTFNWDVICTFLIDLKSWRVLQSPCQLCTTAITAFILCTILFSTLEIIFLMMNMFKF